MNLVFGKIPKVKHYAQETLWATVSTIDQALITLVKHANQTVIL